MMNDPKRVRRLSVKDRIKSINKKAENGGDEILLRTFASKKTNKEDEKSDATNNPIENSTEKKSTPSSNKEDEAKNEVVVEEPHINVKEQVERLNLADLAAKSNKKRMEYLSIKENANSVIQTLQESIFKNNEELARYTKTKPEERHPDQIEFVDRIRAEQGKMRKAVRKQLNLCVESAQDRIQCLLLEQKALYQAWEGEFLETTDE